MKSNGAEHSIPEGFAVSGTYCGVCRSRVKLDLALLVSRTDCTIVTSLPGHTQSYTGSAVLLHQGVALPDGKRGQEIAAEISEAASYHLQTDASCIHFFAYGVSGQFFRPSLVVQSLRNLLSGLDESKSEAVEKVIDTMGDVTYAKVSLQDEEGSSLLCGMAADGMRQQPGLCVILTDCAAAAAQIEEAVAQCRNVFDLNRYAVLVMSNGAAKHKAADTEWMQAMKQVFTGLGFQKMLQDVI